MRMPEVGLPSPKTPVSRGWYRPFPPAHNGHTGWPIPYRGESRPRRAPLSLMRMVPPARSRPRAVDAPTWRRGGSRQRKSPGTDLFPPPPRSACPPARGVLAEPRPPSPAPGPPAASAANNKRSVMIIVINKYRALPAAGLPPVGVRQPRQAARGQPAGP
ncbi:unnamed protein product [Coccothraustes coccothraustes]